MQSSALGKIENLSLQERVYRALRGALLGGHYMPGEQLSIRSLAATVGASAQPVREALARLCAEGAIELLPNRMFRLKPADSTRLRELWHLRMLLEADACALAAECISADDIQRLREIADIKRAAVRRNDIREVLVLNTEWHFTIYRAAACSLQQAVIETLWLQMAPLVAALTRHQLQRDGRVEVLLEYIDNQELLIDALEARDSKRASAELTRLLTRSREHFLTLLQQGVLNVPG